MHSLIFATNNLHKAEEIKSVVGPELEVKTLKEAGIFKDIAEPHNTIEKNASEKSSVIFNLTKKDCFGEDTGLEVDVLNGEPGVKSARYCDDGSFRNNTDKLLHNLRDKKNRNARFKTIISLMLNGKEYKFEGVCEGTIIANKRGNNGFGYDSVFIPKGSDKTFAEMDLQEKNIFSHRRKAAEKLLEFLKEQNNKT